MPAGPSIEHSTMRTPSRSFCGSVVTPGKLMGRDRGREKQVAGLCDGGEGGRPPTELGRFRDRLAARKPRERGRVPSGGAFGFRFTAPHSVFTMIPGPV